MTFPRMSTASSYSPFRRAMKGSFFRLIRGSKRPGYNSMDTLKPRLFTDVGVKGKSVAQLCYNNRRDLLPVRTLEAGRCVGFDVSEEFIKQARLLTRTNNQDCEFVCVDAHEILASYDGFLDIVFFTSGSLRWMADPELCSIDCAVGE